MFSYVRENGVERSKIEHQSINSKHVRQRQHFMGVPEFRQLELKNNKQIAFLRLRFNQFQFDLIFFWDNQSCYLKEDNSLPISSTK